MREFYVLGLDPSREDLQAIVDADVDGFDTTLLNQGVRIEQIPDSVRLCVSNDKRTDLLGNAFGWKIMSEEAIGRLLEMVPKADIQLFHLSLWDQDNQSQIMSYRLVNSLRLLPALAFSRGNRMVYAHQVVIRSSSVPFGVNLFRCIEAPHHWIISGQLWRRLEGLDGVVATPIQVAE